jgi:hypothetical protein
MVVHACYSSEGTKQKIGGSQSRQAWAKSKTLPSNITRAKKAGGVAQVVDHLPTNAEHRVQNSVPQK